MAGPARKLGGVYVGPVAERDVGVGISRLAPPGVEPGTYGLEGGHGDHQWD